LILFDAKAPEGRPGVLPGGNGIAFDWQVLEGVRGKLAYMLAGGLLAMQTVRKLLDARRGGG